MLGNILSGIQNLSYKAGLRESKDEILTGEIITIMVEKGYPPTGFWTDSDYQRMRFLAQDSILHSVTITVDRRTGGNAITSAIIGDRATLEFLCEIKNYLADPDDLIEIYKTSLKKLFKLPTGNIKIDYQFNSVVGKTAEVIDIKDFILKGKEGREKLEKLIFEKINLLKEKLLPYKINRDHS